MKITYVPREGDPARVKWAGVAFEANVPREVSHPEIVAAAPTNPWFEVEGEAPKNKGGRKPNPKTAEEYRAWAIGWISRSEDPEAIQARWDAEQAMRETCGVGEDDYDAINLIMQPRMHDLRRAAAA